LRLRARPFCQRPRTCQSQHAWVDLAQPVGREVKGLLCVCGGGGGRGSELACVRKNSGRGKRPRRRDSGALHRRQRCEQALVAGPHPPPPLTVRSGLISTPSSEWRCSFVRSRVVSGVSSVGAIVLVFFLSRLRRGRRLAACWFRAPPLSCWCCFVCVGVGCVFCRCVSCVRSGDGGGSGSGEVTRRPPPVDPLPTRLRTARFAEQSSRDAPATGPRLSPTQSNRSAS
jgi:hypothetical protein